MVCSGPRYTGRQRCSAIGPFNISRPPPASHPEPRSSHSDARAWLYGPCLQLCSLLIERHLLPYLRSLENKLKSFPQSWTLPMLPLKRRSCAILWT